MGDEVRSLHKQRGFIYLTTGANGAGKTLFTLKEVRDRSVKEGRPVAYNGRFDMVAEFNWKKIDLKDWQAEPDGTIFLIDECHNDLPLRPTGSAVPEYVKMLAEHRRRGFDFYLITQHPSNIDSFVRRLIGSPSWHRHLSPAPGSKTMVSMFTWPSVEIQCEKPGPRQTAAFELKPHPKDVYSWYNSATLHTVKRKIPKAFYFLAFAFVAVPVAFYLAYKTVGMNHKAPVEASAPSATAAAATPGGRGKENSVMTSAEYAQSFHPRIAGLPHTAPRYDALTAPTVAPYPAACIAGVRPGQKASSCSCYSQQATRLDIDEGVCRQIAANGFFMDSARPEQQVSKAVGGTFTQPPTPPDTVNRDRSISDGEMLATMKKSQRTPS